MVNLIHMISKPIKVIKESYRVLKPNGKIIITSFDMNEMSFFNKIKMAYRYIKAFGKVPKDAKKVKTTLNSVELMLKQNNFEIIRSETIGNVNKAMYLVAKKI